jgi:hypothetical protein
MSPAPVGSDGCEFAVLDGTRIAGFPVAWSAPAGVDSATADDNQSTR